MNVYDFTVQAQDGTDVALSEYRGRVLHRGHPNQSDLDASAEFARKFMQS